MAGTEGATKDEKETKKRFSRGEGKKCEVGDQYAYCQPVPWRRSEVFYFWPEKTGKHSTHVAFQQIDGMSARATTTGELVLQT